MFGDGRLGCKSLWLKTMGVDFSPEQHVPCGPAGGSIRDSHSGTQPESAVAMPNRTPPLGAGAL